MKTLLKIILFILLILAISAPGLCEKAPVRIIAMKGPTAMGLVQMMHAAGDSDTYQFSIASAVDEVPPRILRGEVDIACVPANLASVLYNNSEGAIQVLAVNTLGVLYIVERGTEINSLSDLRGKTVYASGKGATPEYALNYLLTNNGIDPESDLTLEWKSEHSECLSALLMDEHAVALLPQPFVTTAQMKAADLRIAVDLNEAWDELEMHSENPSALLTGVTIVRRAFATEHPEEVEAFLAAYRGSVAYVQENPEEAAAWIGEFEIVPEAVALKALPFCGITLSEG